MIREIVVLLNLITSVVYCVKERYDAASYHVLLAICIELF